MSKKDDIREFLITRRASISPEQAGLPTGVTERRVPGLKLRALHSNGDFDTYWDYHLAQEQRRVHRSRYADNAIPRAA